jgi:glutathione S-transferase
MEDSMDRATALTLYYHPFASFCQKVLIALYENELPFTPHLVDLGDPAARKAFLAVWPVGKFPVLGDADRGRIVPESSTIIEYLAVRYPGPSELIPADPEQALEVRARDRFFDSYVHEPMQKIVTDRLRPPDGHDLIGVAAARDLLATAYGLIETAMASRTWAAGDDFSMADCAAAPALFYAAWVQPFADTHPATAAYLDRLRARPSFARVVEEARPYRHLFPAG